MRRLALLLLVGAMLLVSVLACGSSTPSAPTPTRTHQQTAWYSCTYLIDQELGLSFLDAQKYNSSLVTLVETGVYQVQVHYAKVGNTYQCILEEQANGDMMLISLKMVQ
jgi:hypothetical protein